jgi:hypothetical protein
MIPTMAFIAKVMRVFKKRDTKDGIDGIGRITNRVTQGESFYERVGNRLIGVNFTDMSMDVFGNLGRRKDRLVTG